jgi:hypothetical protein
MHRATPRFASAYDPRDPPLDPDFGIAFVLATASDVRTFVMANTEPRKRTKREKARAEVQIRLRSIARSRERRSDFELSPMVQRMLGGGSQGPRRSH